MPRPPKPPTFLARHRRPILVVLMLGTVACIAAGLLLPEAALLGIGGLVFFIALAFATFVDGPPRAGDGTYESGIGIYGTWRGH